MKLTILGSGGCTVTPKPFCSCRICKQARTLGLPYTRTGPSAFLHDARLLIDTPAESTLQLNRSGIDGVEYLVLTHLDPDHVEGLRVIEQINLDFRTWRSQTGKIIHLLIPEELNLWIDKIATWYGPLITFYEESGFLCRHIFNAGFQANDISIRAIRVEKGQRPSFIIVFEKNGKKLVYAPCDIKPFPENRAEILGADLLVIQPGIFESGLKHGFVYPKGHISRTTLYTFEETLELAKRIDAKKILFTHIEEYWNRSHDDYKQLEKEHDGIQFAHDGMEITV